MAVTAPRRAGPAGADQLAGAIGAGVALAVGELISALDTSSSSLVTAVGDEVIDTFAAALKDAAIALFGTNDKAALVVGIVVVALGLGSAIGRASRARPWINPAGFTAFALLGAWAYARAPFTNGVLGVAAAAIGAACGSAALWWLQRLEPVPAPARVPIVDGVAAPGHEAGIVSAPAAPGGPTGGPSRRMFLTTSALVAGGAVGAAALSRTLRGADPVQQARASTVLADPVSATPLPEAQPFSRPGLSPYITPTGDFYRIDTALVAPRVEVDSWRLELTGLVGAPLTLTFDELLALDSIEVPVTLQCVSNEIGGDLVGTAVWQGVPLEALLDRVRPADDATQIVGRSVDGFTAGFPRSVVGDGRSALVAYAMNGEPLPARHGFPARLVVAGLYGYVSATKWLREIELTRWEDFDGYWVPRGWSKEGPIKTMSRIDVPRGGERVAAGTVAVAGVAWAPTRGIRAVEVQVDDGPWLECELGAVASDETWVQWLLRWDAPPGDHVLRVRATDGSGEVQTADMGSPRPDGATGHHARRVTVEA